MTPRSDRNTYYTFAAKFLRKDVVWEEFRRKFIDHGGDGIYAAWSLCYQEDSIKDVRRILESMHLGGRLNTEEGICPNAEKIQPMLMQFTTNQKGEQEMKIESEALYKTIKYFS